MKEKYVRNIIVSSFAPTFPLEIYQLKSNFVHFFLLFAFNGLFFCTLCNGNSENPPLILYANINFDLSLLFFFSFSFRFSKTANKTQKDPQTRAEKKAFAMNTYSLKRLFYLFTIAKRTKMWLFPLSIFFFSLSVLFYYSLHISFCHSVCCSAMATAGIKITPWNQRKKGFKREQQ